MSEPLANAPNDSDMTNSGTIGDTTAHSGETAARSGETPLGTPVQHPSIPTGAVVINNDYLRLLVREAVERESVNLIAPIRTQQQVNAAGIRQLNQDYGRIDDAVKDLAAIVRGDDKLGIPGLMKTVSDISKKLSEYNNKLDDLTIYIRVGFAVLVVLGIIDNERLSTFIAAILKAAGL